MRVLVQKLPKTLVVATSNSHKLREWQQLLSISYPLNITSLHDINQKVKPPVENGHAFQENANIKSLYYSRLCPFPVLSDDSGLTVPDLNGEPGVFSSRYAGDNSTDSDNIELLLLKIEQKNLKNPVAFFTCAISLAWQGMLLFEAEGSLHGTICHAKKGQEGFGYDPVFYYPPFQKTLSELPFEAKNQISHRFQAVQKLSLFLNSHSQG